MNGPSIRAIGLAVPPHRRRQEELAEFMQRAHGFDPARSRYLRALYHRSGIETRYSCLPDFAPHDADPTLFTADHGGRPAPSTSRRMEAYREHAPRLAHAACLDLFAQPCAGRPQEVDHLFVVSCTGFLAPGIDVLLARALGLRADVGRSLIGFQGCQGGLTALRLADTLCRARTTAVALIVCVELCSLHFQLEPSEDNLLANALFGDGASAVLVAGADAAPARGNDAARAGDAARGSEAARAGDAGTEHAGGIGLTRAATLLCPGTLEDMVWKVGDFGFELRLSASVKRTLAAEVPSLVARALELDGEAFRSIPIWAVHPGGPAILDGLEHALELPPERFAASRAVLRDYGNMSSATIFFVLRRLFEGDTSGGRGIALAFGPGLTVEAALWEMPARAGGARPGDGS